MLSLKPKDTSHADSGASLELALSFALEGLSIKLAVREEWAPDLMFFDTLPLSNPGLAPKVFPQDGTCRSSSYDGASKEESCIGLPPNVFLHDEASCLTSYDGLSKEDSCLVGCHTAPSLSQVASPNGSSTPTPHGASLVQGNKTRQLASALPFNCEPTWIAVNFNRKPPLELKMHLAFNNAALQ